MRISRSEIKAFTRIIENLAYETHGQKIDRHEQGKNKNQIKRSQGEVA